MLLLISNSLMLATLLGGWELLLILATILILLGARRLPEIIKGFGKGLSHFRKEVARLAHDAGKSVGGIYGKPAAEALTPNNETAELYDPSALRQPRPDTYGRKRWLSRLLRRLWQFVLEWLSIKE